jgi:chromosome segregation ATPase
LQADKDQLRAEFAMSTRRLELLIEQLKADSAGQLAELGKKADAINVLKIELHDKTQEIEATHAHEASVRDLLDETSTELSATNTKLHDAERLIADKEAGIVKLSGDLNERALAVDSQRFEIIALRTQIDAFKDQIGEMRNQISIAQSVEAELRTQLTMAKREIAAASQQERAENAMLRDHINQIAAEIAQLTMKLEGPFSPIEPLLADTVLPVSVASAHASNRGTATGANGERSRTQATRTLGDRIRALQTKSNRQPSAR